MYGSPNEIDFWLWLDAGFEDRAIEAWVFETVDGEVTYVDDGITHTDGIVFQAIREDRA